MPIKHLTINNVRNLTVNKLELSENENIIYGKNGSGKTSFLEAISILATGRSFQPVGTQGIINKNSEKLLVYSKFKNNKNIEVPIGIEKTNKDFNIKIAGNRVNRISQLAAEIPLQIITPESISLFKGGPIERRKFIDWGLFHVKHDFNSQWKNYNKALQQRNSLIKRNKADLKAINGWNTVMADVGGFITNLREEYIEELTPYLEKYIKTVLPAEKIIIKYKKGWKDESLLEVLNKSIDQDIKVGFTTKGPHRADFQLLIDNIEPKHFYSRGQIKLLTEAFKLAQVSYLMDKQKKSSVILVDDLPSELDKKNRYKVIELMRSLKAQLFITTIDYALIGKCAKENYKTNIIHIKSGEIV